jgi:hypothetical protein
MKKEQELKKNVGGPLLDFLFGYHNIRKKNRKRRNSKNSVISRHENR